MTDFMWVLFGLFMALLSAQALYNIHTSVFGWLDSDAVKKRHEADNLLPPHYSFTALLPAYKEEAVIEQTILQIARANYDQSNIQILVLCRAGDIPTIQAATTTIIKYGLQNAWVLVYEGDIPGKPVQLNQGLIYATGDFTVIFDAEDDISPNIFSIANTMHQKHEIDVLQAGVQLMDYNSSWFSVHNVLEYFFQFRSRMYYQAKVGVLPLGGNTCFFKTYQLREFGGWDDFCLTEDAEIGLRMSAAGKKFEVFYDANHVTREETPPTLKAFIKQRTRWNQGFLQTISRDYWLTLPTIRQRLFALYTLGLPVLMAVLLILTPIFLWMAFNIKMPVIVSLISFVPLGLLLILMAVNLVGLREFDNDHNLKIKLRWYLIMVITFVPFQYVLSYAALRAVHRAIVGAKGWEKTAHSGVHRNTNEVSAGI